MFAKLKKKLEEEEEKKLNELGRNIPKSPSLLPLGEASPRRMLAGIDPARAHSSEQLGLSSIHGSQLSLHSSCESLSSTPRNASNTAALLNKSEKTNCVQDTSSLTPDVRQKDPNGNIANIENTIDESKDQLNEILSCKFESSANVDNEAEKLCEVPESEMLKSLKNENELLQNQLKEMQALLKKASKSPSSDQEASNIRHLLVKNQHELRECEAAIKKKDEKLKEALNRIGELEEKVKQLKQQVGSNAEKKQVKQLKEEKTALEKEVDRLKQESLVSGNIIEEKQSQIEHLENKLKLLDQRVQDSSLPEDDRFQALVTERDGLEKKLDETVQHLNEIKTTWSEKINSLESQIFHLNKKIAEDNEDSSKLEDEVRELRIKLKEKENDVWKLEESIETKDKELKNLKSSCDEEVNQIKCSSVQEKEELNAQIAALEQQLVDLSKERDKERQEAQIKLNDLMSSQSDHIEKEIEMENRLSVAEDENRKLKIDLSKKDKECNALMQTVSELKATSVDTQIRVTELEHENTTMLSRRKSLEMSIQGCQAELERINEEKGDLLVRNAQLSQQLELTKQDLSQEQAMHNKIKEENSLEIQKLEEELKRMKEKVSVLEQQASEYIENSGRVLELKNLAAELEKTVSEKNRTIKLQQQRLNDMKKMLQKELKFQSGISDPLPNSENIESSSLPQNKDSKQNSNVQSGKDFINAKHITRIGALSQDDIGFQYLKHVVFKFMTSSEYEAQHLTKAVSVLLQFTPEEERLIRETLEWKTSWFGPKPQSHKIRSGKHFQPS